MDLLSFVHLLNALLMMAMPIGLAIFLTRKWKFGWSVWQVGAATFILSQVGHIPFNSIASNLLNRTGLVAWSPTAQLYFNGVFLGLSAGIFEEVARFLVLRFWIKGARSWRNGILFGAGHGGAEAIIFGGLALYSFFQLAAIRIVNLSTLYSGNQLVQAQQQVHAYWSMAWYTAMLGVLERLFTIPCQIALAVLVMQVFLRKNILWLFLAILYHALIDGIAVIGQRYVSIYALEGILGLLAILSVAIIFLLYRPEPVQTIIEAGSVGSEILPKPVQETPENLEKTRYQ